MAAEQKSRISRMIFSAMVMADTDKGIKFDSTMARPDTELTAAWLGIRKK